MAEGTMQQQAKAPAVYTGMLNDPNSQELALPDGGKILLSSALIRKYAIRGKGELVTDQEALFALSVCRARRLNPFTGEVYFIKYGENDPMQTVVAKDTIMARAESYPDYEGFDAGIVVWDPESKLMHRVAGAIVPPGHDLVGGWAQVFKKGRRLPAVEVSLEEYQQKKRDGSVSAMWRLPKQGGKAATMIRKVALCQSVREAYPEALGRMYDQDELPPLDVSMGPGKAFEITEDRPQQPLPAAPISQAAPRTEEKVVVPPAEHERRARRNEVTLPDGRIIKTAGVTGPNLADVERRGDAGPDQADAVVAFLRARTGYDDPTYLRDAEAVELLEMLRVAFDDVPGPSPQEEPAAEAAALPEGFVLGQDVWTRLGRGEVVGAERNEDDPRGPMVLLKMNNGHRAGDTVRFYAQEITAEGPAARLGVSTSWASEADAPKDGRGRVWIHCRGGPHAGQQVAAEVCEAKCEEAGDCPDLMLAKKSARAKAAAAALL